jgi:hypothetical protein
VIVNEYCYSSANFMNLCDDLHALATKVTRVDSVDKWNTLLEDLKGIAQNDEVNFHYAKPSLAALLKLCNPKSVTCKLEPVKNCLTCTITLT